MNLLHFIRSLDPRGGGPQEGLRQIVGEMDRIGWASAVATLDDPAAPWVADFPAPVTALGPAQGGYGYAPRAVGWLRSNAGRFDAVIVHGLWQYHSFATWRALRGSATPYFTFPHGMLDPWFKRTYPVKHLKKLLYWPWGEYRVLRDSRRVLFTCEQERVLARRSFALYSANEAVAGFGIGQPAIDAEADQQAFLDRFPGLRGKRLLLYLSRITPKKGCDLLIEALAQTRDRHDLHLVMAGPIDPGLENTLHALAQDRGIADRITWTGMLSGSLKWGAYRAADAFILPSHQENFGIVVAEALAVGRAVLISDQVNIWQEIVKEGAGLVAPDTLAGTTDLLLRWEAMGADARHAMAENGPDCFMRHFHIEGSVRRLAQIVTEGVAGDAGRTPGH